MNTPENDKALNEALASLQQDIIKAIAPLVANLIKEEYVPEDLIQQVVHLHLEAVSPEIAFAYKERYNIEEITSDELATRVCNYIKEEN